MFAYFMVIFEYFSAVWYTWQIGNVMVMWFIFPRFGILCQEKSGNPDADTHLHDYPDSFPLDGLGSKSLWTMTAAVCM
jgi:hypothetical protein